MCIYTVNKNTYWSRFTTIYKWLIKTYLYFSAKSVMISQAFDIVTFRQTVNELCSPQQHSFWQQAIPPRPHKSGSFREVISSNNCMPCFSCFVLLKQQEANPNNIVLSYKPYLLNSRHSSRWCNMFYLTRWGTDQKATAFIHFQMHFFNENIWISFGNLLNFVPKGHINYILVLV